MTRNEAAFAAKETAEPAALMRSALEFHMAERYDMARDLYGQVIALNPTDAVAWHHLGLIEHVAGHHAAAVELIGRAIAFRPDYAQAYANLIAVFRAARQFDKAMENAKKAVALDPRFAPAHSNLGNVLEDKGDLEAALAAYLEACRLDPFFVEAHTNTADLLRKLGRHESALKVCEAISAKRPEAAHPYFCAGNILREIMRPTPRSPPIGRPSPCVPASPRPIATSATFSSFAVPRRRHRRLPTGDRSETRHGGGALQPWRSL